MDPVQPSTAGNDAVGAAAPAGAAPAVAEPAPRRGRRLWRWALGALGVLLAALVAARLAAPALIQRHVNRVLDRSPDYDGQIGAVHLQLWRGAYSIDDVKIVKTTGNVPVPFFSATRVDLAIQWDALRHGRAVGRVVMQEPQINFVDGGDKADTQTGAAGPWLDMLADLFPFKINSLAIHNGELHFRAFKKEPRVDVFIEQVEGAVENLTNIYDQVTPLVAVVEAKGKAMGQADFELGMKLDPFSYRPTFKLATRLIGLDVTKINSLALAYGAFDFEGGWFDLVVEMDAHEGRVEGYVKPLFRQLKVLSLRKDVREDGPLQLFWEALVGVTAKVLENAPRDQVGTRVPFQGDVASPKMSILDTIGGLLRNAFVRAYLPQLEGTGGGAAGLEFGEASVVPNDAGSAEAPGEESPAASARREAGGERIDQAAPESGASGEK